MSADKKEPLKALHCWAVGILRANGLVVHKHASKAVKLPRRLHVLRKLYAVCPFPSGLSFKGKTIKGSSFCRVHFGHTTPALARPTRRPVSPQNEGDGSHQCTQAQRPGGEPNMMVATTCSAFQQGSLHYTSEHCLVNGGFPVFWWKEPCFKWANWYLLRSPVQ